MFEKLTAMNGETIFVKVESISSIRARGNVSDITMNSGQEFVVSEPAEDLIERMTAATAPKRADQGRME